MSRGVFPGGSPVDPHLSSPLQGEERQRHVRSVLPLEKGELEGVLADSHHITYCADHSQASTPPANNLRLAARIAAVSASLGSSDQLWCWKVPPSTIPSRRPNM